MSEKSTDIDTVEGAIDSDSSTDGWLSNIWLDVAERYERYEYLDADETVILEWHTFGSIISHWSLLLFTVLATITGVAFWTGWYGPLDIGIWDGYHVSYVIHIWAGVLLAVAAFVLFPYYKLILEGESVRLTRNDVKEQIVITLSFLGLARYIPGYKKARRTRDDETGEWVGYHPMQTAFWYGTWFFVALLTLTGFALWAELTTDPAWWISTLGFMVGWVTYENMLRIHLVSMFFFVASVAVHAYFSVLPSNHDFLMSMIHGKLEGWAVDDQNRPETKGLSRSTDGFAKRMDGIARRLGTGGDLQDHLKSGPEPTTVTEAESETTGEKEPETPDNGNLSDEKDRR